MYRYNPSNSIKLILPLRSVSKMSAISTARDFSTPKKLDDGTHSLATDVSAISYLHSVGEAVAQWRDGM